MSEALKCLKLGTVTMDQHVAVGHLSATMGLSFSQVLQWIQQYGLPTLIKVLTMIAPIASTLPYGQLIAWVTAALIAIQGGQPMPPLPTPKPA